VEVDLRELGDDEVQQVLVSESGDLRVEAELLDHLARARREPSDIGAHVAGNVRGVVEEASEVERARVVELLARDGLEDGLHVLNLALQLHRSFEDGCLGRLEDAVESSQDDERQDHAAILGLLVDATQLVGDRPDEGRVVPNTGIAHLRNGTPARPSLRLCRPRRLRALDVRRRR
jgi:hypothetical protein